jgi:hypothetical protein
VSCLPLESLFVSVSGLAVLLTCPWPLSPSHFHFHSSIIISFLFDSLASTTFLLPPLLPFLRLYFCHLYDFPVHCHSPARLQPAISSFATLTVTNLLLVILVPNQAQATTAHTLSNALSEIASWLTPATRPRRFCSELPPCKTRRVTSHHAGCHRLNASLAP